MRLRIRLALLVVLAAIVQAGVFPFIRLFGVVPDLGLLVAVGIAYRLGSSTGAIVGFACGLAMDLFLETPLGLTALAWCLTAWLVGGFHAGLVNPPRLVSPLLGGMAGALSGLMFVSVGVIFGVETLQEWGVLGVVVRMALYDALLAPFVILAVDRFVPDELRDAAEMRF